MTRRLRTLDEPAPPPDPGLPPAPVDLEAAAPTVTLPPTPPPGISRDRREERIRRWWAERAEADRVRSLPPTGEQ